MRTLLLSNVQIPGAADGAPITDISIRDGVIDRIGTVGHVSADGTSPDAAIDCAGRFVVPGLWDRHVHMNQWALARQRIDLSAARSATDLAQALRPVATERRAAGAKILIGYGFRDALWPDNPTPGLLDTATGELPAVMISGDLHSAWLNSAALRRFGRIYHPTGVLREAELFAIMGGLSDVSDDDLDAAVADAAAAAAARGVVGIVDFEMPDSAPVWARRIQRGADSLRVVCSVWPDALDAAIGRGLRTGEYVSDTGDLAVTGPLKVITDGSLNTRTAYCDDPYPGDDGGHGILSVPFDDLVATMDRARAAGISSAIHAIGDHANRMAVDAFERVGASGSIEHVQLIHRQDALRMARLGIVASVQPEHAMDDRDVVETHWAGRTSDAFAFRGLIDAGVRIVLGSDAPVAPLDPWISLSAAVFRSRDGREPWHPEQRITAAEALMASTNGVSALRPGGVADLVVVDRDPHTCDAEELRSMAVFATFLGGRPTFGPL
jgi:predicted amidohydrolase YtcJ